MPPHQAPSVEQSITYFRGWSPMPGGRTRGEHYNLVRNATTEILGSHDPKHKALVERANKDILRVREVAPGAVQDNRFLSNLSVQYGNDEYIGLYLMPDVPAAQLAGEYPVYDKRSRLAAPDDSMAGRTSANEIQDGRSTGSFFCKGYALKNSLSVLTLRNQVAPLDEMVDLTEATADLIAIRREIRIAGTMTNAALYAAANKTTIGAGSRWDTAGGGNPIKDLQDGTAALWNGRGQTKIMGWCSLPVWNVLSRHPAILDLFKYGGQAPGLATPDMIAKFFGWDGMLVSKARNDLANEGQTANYDRIWGKFFGITRVAARASIRNAGWGMTLRFGSVLTRVWFDPAISTEGGYWGQVSTHEDHNVQAADTGYLITSPIS